MLIIRHLDKTNQMALELFAVMVDLDFEAYPLAYLLLEKKGPPLSRTRALIRFLECMRDTGVIPETVLTDKDQSQIFAITEVFGVKAVQLCYWHALRAIDRGIASKSGSVSENLISRYRNMDPMRLGQFQLDHTFPDVGNLEPIGTIGKSTISRILYRFRLHYNAHPLIPNWESHQQMSSDQIYIRSVEEMYQLVKELRLDAVWMYLWINWYCPEEWRLWALAYNPGRIPFARTTMFVESHWRTVKRDFLWNHARPVRAFFVPIQ